MKDNNSESLSSKINQILESPQSSWKNFFKEMIVGMIATNTNDLVWYSNFLSRCEYEFHFNHSYTASTYFNGNNFVIVVNPIILILIGKNQTIAILKHEAAHIMNYHLSRSSKYKTIDKDILSTAMDIVINGDKNQPLIKDLPGTGEFIDSPVKCNFYETLQVKYGIELFEKNRAFEYYIDLISNIENSKLDEIVARNQETEDQDCRVQENEDQDRGNACRDDIVNKIMTSMENKSIQLDNHESGDDKEKNIDLPDSIKDKFMGTTLNELINASTDASRGFTPSEAMKALLSIEKRLSNKDWKKVFAKKMNFLLSSQKKIPNPSRQHQILHDDPDFYGSSYAKRLKIGFIADVSGSVTDEFLIDIISEIHAIQIRYSIKEIPFVQVDTEVKSVTKLNKSDKIFVRHGDGGTIMEPGFKALIHQPKEKIPNIIICATDGYIEEEFEDLLLPNSIHVVWLIGEDDELFFDVSKYKKSQMSIIKINSNSTQE
jgi:predicted metal-dependent peptidase